MVAVDLTPKGHPPRPHFGQNFTHSFSALLLDLGNLCLRACSAPVALKLNPYENLFFCSVVVG